MIYHLTLQTAGYIAGIVLLLFGLWGLVRPDASQAAARNLPRSRVAGFVLLTIAFFWSFWLLATMEMGEFSSFRKPLLFILPVGFLLVLRFVDEFLAARALGILFLLAAEPLLDAAFFRSETSRLLVTVFAYILIVAGLFWVTMPYLMRDQINWSARTNGRWRITHGVVFLYGVAILACAVTRY
ncbi:MAG TPA: hypothetical protein VE031_03720 [Chthoniobacterales bacterium]|nr:hypothetical protein [Chthoniobacterales bacterium]